MKWIAGNVEELESVSMISPWLDWTEQLSSVRKWDETAGGTTCSKRPRQVGFESWARCGEDTASVCGERALPAELLGRAISMISKCIYEC